MTGEWTWQLAAILGALAGSILTSIVIAGRHRSRGRELEESRKAILDELRQIERHLSQTKMGQGEGLDRGKEALPEPIRMVQMSEEPPEEKAA